MTEMRLAEIKAHLERQNRLPGSMAEELVLHVELLRAESARLRCPTPFPALTRPTPTTN